MPTQAGDYLRPIPRNQWGWDPLGLMLAWDRVAGNGRAPLPYAIVGVPWSPAEREAAEEWCEGWDCGEYMDLPRILGIAQ